jgi:hypothetical protein
LIGCKEQEAKTCFNARVCDLREKHHIVYRPF